MMLQTAPSPAVRLDRFAIPVRPAPVRKHCTDCGISRTDQPARCASACQFIQPDYAGAETRIHGRERQASKGDEQFFGVYESLERARLRHAQPGAQWSGVTTRLAARMLETGMVDAVLTVKPSRDDRWAPEPVLVTDPAALAGCRGMRMGFAPLLALLEPACAAGVRKIAVIAIPCQVYALRALETELGFEQVYVIGTPCSDNTTTERFHQFLALLDRQPQTIAYLEFRADYQVELRFDDGHRRTVPFLQLPISRLPADFFPLTCRSCVDYVNSLSDITIGYMGGSGEQWILVRNERGRQIRALLAAELIAGKPLEAGRRQPAVRGFLANVRRAAGGLPVRRMPGWLRPLVGWLMPRVGPRGLEFARARVEMKAVESIVHLQRERPRALARLIPSHVWKLAASYGLSRTECLNAVNARRKQ